MTATTNTERCTTDTTNKLSVTMETFNCHGYKESCDYILTRASRTDFMCLTETWINPSELIQNNVNDHVMSNTNKYTVFSKSGMSGDDEHSPGRPFGGVAIICRHIAGVTYELINCVNNRILALLVKDTHNIPIHILICTYMPYFSNNGSTQTDEYLVLMLCRV